MTIVERQAVRPDMYGWAVDVRASDLAQRRRAVVDILQLWEAPDSVVETARLGVSELLTNVLAHSGRADCYLLVARVGGLVVVQVFDASPSLPVLREPASDGTCGRGLWLLREMADDFGYARTWLGVGKVVWFACALASLDGSASCGRTC
ncbi:ATP-binding protein [Streptomyces marincola]|nr:ATP-binding protein [Streptomyces marincola]